MAIKFCPRCGGATEEKIPVGEHEKRYVCTACGAVHYQNPKMVRSVASALSCCHFSECNFSTTTKFREAEFCLPPLGYLPSIRLDQMLSQIIRMDKNGSEF